MMVLKVFGKLGCIPDLKIMNSINCSGATNTTTAVFIHNNNYR